MGNCVSFQLSCDQTVNGIFKCLCGEGYIRTLKENVRALKREMEDLKAIHDEVRNKVTREEETCHRQRLKAVQVWFERVEDTDKDYCNLLSTSDVQLQKLCFCGLCSKNVWSSYKYGKKVFLLLEEVKKLKLEGNFEEVTEPNPRSGVQERPTGPTIGHEIIFNQAWNRLMKDEIGIMGLHGMGGVGKTTLLLGLYNKFITEFIKKRKEKEFINTEKDGQIEVVIWVMVSNGANVSRLREDIAKQLHLCGEEWGNKDESEKAVEIYNYLKKKRFVLMLDDMWEEVDLETIGVPFLSRDNGCKVVFTTRLLHVCERMGDHEPMQVNCLETKKAWELFENVVGTKTLKSDPGIEELARVVAEKCGGLPLALKVIGKTMTSKTTVQEWTRAVDVLTRSAGEYPDIEKKILSILKYSYDSLEDEHIKSCFVYCALFSEDSLISKEELIKYWICEGFMGESEVITRAMDKGYDIVGTLLRANLLMETGTLYVVMHDTVRKMAIWIASSFGIQKENFVVQASMGLREVPKIKDWGAVRRMSLIDNEIEEITCSSKCSELTTLFLQNNKLKKLSGEFIKSMQKLVVLDLSGNHDFNKLPEEISELVSLQYLNLSRTYIKELPFGFQELTKLIHLDLRYTTELCSISGISKVSSLRYLDLEESNVHGDVSLVKELQFLDHLQVLNLTISTELGLEQILYDQKLANCINGLKILGFQQNPFNVLLLASMENLRCLYVERSHFSNMKSRQSTSPSPCFSNLSVVGIKECSGIKDLTWLLFAPNIVQLEIENFEEVEEIINKEEETSLFDIAKPLEKLKKLMLKSMPKLESIYWSTLPFPFLRSLHIIDCPKLRKLPLNASSVPRVEEFQIRMYPPKQISDLEWEDEATKTRFLPVCWYPFLMSYLNYKPYRPSNYKPDEDPNACAIMVEAYVHLNWNFTTG